MWCVRVFQLTDDRQPRKCLSRQRYPAHSLRKLGPSVVARSMLRYETQLTNLCFECVGTRNRVYTFGNADHFCHARAMFGSDEVVPHASAHIARGSDIEHTSASISEEVDTRAAGQIIGQVALATLL